MAKRVRLSENETMRSDRCQKKRWLSKARKYPFPKEADKRDGAEQGFSCSAPHAFLPSSILLQTGGHPRPRHWVNLAEINVVCEVPYMVCWVALAGPGSRMTAVGSTMEQGCMQIVIPALPVPSASVTVMPAKPMMAYVAFWPVLLAAT